jgi:hypothetical protein
VTGIEDRLRDAFSADAATITTPPPAPSRPARFRLADGLTRSRLLVPLAAATAVAVVVAATFIVVPRILPGRADSGGQSPFGSPPRFIAITKPSGLKVISSASGQVVGTLSPPKPREGFTAVTALGNDRTFIAAVQAPNKCVTWLYKFSLSASGRPYNLAPFVVPKLAGGLPNQQGPIFLDLAASANGRYVAFDTLRCSGSHGHVGLIDVRTGSVRLWTFSGGNIDPLGLSLSADGSLLDLVSFLHPEHGHDQFQIDTTWAMRTSSPAGPLARYYHRVYGSWTRSTYAADLSPSGAVTFAASINADYTPRFVQVVSVRTASGRQFGRTYVFTKHQDVRAVGLSLDLSGRYLLVYGWSDVQKPANIEYPAVEIDLATGRERVIKGATTGSVNGTAW